MDEVKFGAPYIDIDEWRDAPRRHRYVHGGFEDTHTRFSFYFPPIEHYGGRFFQYLEGGAGGHENLLAEGGYAGLGVAWMFDLAFDELGGYLVESNQGHFTGEGLGTRRDGSAEADMHLFGASAECAMYGKQLAGEMYGSGPHHGYVFGVSGGGLRSTYCLENRPDVWDGAAPHAGVGKTTQWSAWARAWLIARDKFAQVTDALEPGGSGEPFAGLTHAERGAVAELYRRGWPRGAENQFARFGPWAFTMFHIIQEDPSYLDDFWNQPGYQGHDDPQSLAAYVVTAKATVQGVVGQRELAEDPFAGMAVRFGTAGANENPTLGIAVDLDGDPEGLFMSKVTVLSGRAAGREVYISGIVSRNLMPFVETAPDAFNDVEPGDEVMVDNRDFVAFCHYHRYNIAGLLPGRPIGHEFLPWCVDGRPIYPQREHAASKVEVSGEFRGKMIYVQPTLDDMVWFNNATYYDRLVRDHLGDGVDDRYRLWWVENAAHGSPEMIGPMQTPEKDPGVWRSRLVSYDGVTSQALRDLVKWVEDDVPAPAYTGYAETRDNALVLPATAAERGGVQPVVQASANGGTRAEVAVGSPVTFQGTAEQPPGAGAIVRAQWDFEGRGTWEHTDDTVDGSQATVATRATHTYREPGTYFACYRVGAHRDGAEGKGLPVENLARVRVVVTA
jgi:hypothetical protein